MRAYTRCETPGPRDCLRPGVSEKGNRIFFVRSPSVLSTMSPITSGLLGTTVWKAQEPGGGGEPDIKQPPDQDLPDVDEELPETPDGPEAPPFTGEDVEDVGRPKKRDRPLTQ